MQNNLFFKILVSIPVILIALYFIPFLGVCLILFRYFMYMQDNKKKIATPVIIIGVGLICLIPKGIQLLIKAANQGEVPFINKIVDSKLYSVDFMKYSKRLITVGVIFLILYYIINFIYKKLQKKAVDYIDDKKQRNDKIEKENDLKIKIKQEKAKNTSYVKCPNCGSDNLVTGKFGRCKYCRTKLVNENYKE